MIEAFPGVIGSGKDYRCRQLIKQGYSHINFADKVRELTWRIVGWKPGTPEEYEKFKNSDLEIYHSQAKRICIGRDVLVDIGDGVRELISADAWIEVLKRDCKGLDKVCISDLRFKNELRALYWHFGESLKVTFCDYRSVKYNPVFDSPAEKMAQEMLALGFVDGHVLTEKDILSLMGG